MKVLIIESSSTFRFLMKEVLQLSFQEVIESENILDGYEKWTIHSPNLTVICADLVNVDCLNKMVGHDLKQSIPINVLIVMPMWSDKSDLFRKLSTNNWISFIQKPFSKSELLETIKKMGFK